MNWTDVFTEALLLCLLTMIAEKVGLPRVFELVNPVLISQAIEFSDFSKMRVANVNNAFGTMFSTLKEKVEKLLQRFGPARRPSLNQVNFSFGQEARNIQVVPFLIYANLIQTEGCPEILKLCDEAFRNSSFELITCGLQIIPPGAEIPTHKNLYKGFYTYYIVVQGNSNSFIETGGQKNALNTKASVLFESSASSRLKNEGKEDIILLGCELMKPMYKTGSMLNSLVLKIMAESKPVLQACEFGWIR